MKVIRKRTREGSRYRSFIQLQANSQELEFLRASGLMNIKIHLDDISLAGSRLAPLAGLRVLQAYVNRIRNRWNVAITRTTGSVFFDTLILYFKLIAEVLLLLWRLLFGTRKTVRALVRGISLSSNKVEDIKEFEVYVFTSIAAVFRAVEFARNADRQDTFDRNSIQREIEGLSFAGAGAAQGGQAGRLDLPSGRGVADDGEDNEFDDADADEVDVDADTSGA
jgi:hypothetical protein